jgi:hypothetical protein
MNSLYPGVTVLLARVVLGERLRWVQWAGLGLAALGILLSQHESLREEIGTCDQKLALYRAALLSRAESAVGQWITETQACKLAAEARLCACGPQPAADLQPRRENGKRPGRSRSDMYERVVS